MKSLPSNYKMCIGDVMSNFDHIIEPDAESELKSGEYYGNYPAWNFHGVVWFENGLFYCSIKRYGCHVDTIEGVSLKEIMNKCCCKYGGM